MSEAMSAAERFALGDAEARRAMIGRLSAAEIIALDQHWGFWARSEQLPPREAWRVWLMMAGRGFGKTRAGAEWVRARAEADGRMRIALVGATFAEARQVMVEGESGLIEIAGEGRRPKWEPSLKKLSWPNGACR